MSGSTIGGFAGAAIGFMWGGPEGARWGFMIGSAVGGYVDPAQIEGPRLTDAQTQTSNEGVPRPIIYGTACVAGNIIQCGPLVEHKKTQRAGKGGPEQTTYTYTRDVAIRISEAAPLGGTMRLRRVWKNDKLVYDASSGSVLGADSQAFASILTFYSGDETQLPDPTLEALPEENGGGVGNVPAYRGTCYAVLTGLDVTETGGAVPQFRWEVCSDATEETAIGTPMVGTQTHTATLSGNDDDSYIGYLPSSLFFGTSEDSLAVGATAEYGRMDSTLAETWSTEVTNAGDSPGDERLWIRAFSGPWQISADNNFGYCKLLRDGAFVADLRPTDAWPASWWYGEGGFNPEYGGLIWFTASSVYICVRKTGSGAGVLHNKIYRWPLTDASGEIVEADATSSAITAGSGSVYAHMDRGGQMWAIATSEAELVSYSSDLAESSRESLPMSLTGLKGFGVDSGLLMLYFTSQLRIYRMDDFSFVQTVTISGTQAARNSQIVCSDDSIFLKSGRNVKRIAYSPTCLVGVPEGWYLLPDSTSYATDGFNVLPLCSTERVTVTPGTVALSSIVSDLCSRAGVDSDQVDVSVLSGIEVRGFPVARQTPAAEAIRALQQVYFFELPEWGNSGDTGTKLRAVLRGGAIAVTITDDDLVETDDDEGTRAQQVEFPRKVNLTAADPESNYEPITQSAERSTENVKAVGEGSFNTNVVMTRDECAEVSEKLLKVLWEEANGRMERELPEEFTRYTPSDRVSYQDKQWRIDRTEMMEGSVRWHLIRDRASAYSSDATGSNALTPTTQTSAMRGVTLFEVMNLPSLRSADSEPGVYLAVQGLLPGWIGADIYLSVDGGDTEKLVATILEPAVMGELLVSCDEDGADSTGLITVQVYPGGELDSITEDQMDARLNGFALITGGVAEVGQFQIATETSAADVYELTNVLRGQLDTTAAPHYAGDRFVLLDGAVKFLPLDAELAGKTLIFRAVSRGTVPANNPTTSFVFDPPVFVIDGGEIT